jgi:hypothetical protein
MPLINRDTVVIGTAPRMSLLGFKAALDVSLSPARFEAAAAYNAIIAEGVDPCFLLAVFRIENHNTPPTLKALSLNLGPKIPAIAAQVPLAPCRL